MSVGRGPWALVARTIFLLVGLFLGFLAVFVQTEGGWTWTVLMGLGALFCIAVAVKPTR